MEKNILFYSNYCTYSKEIVATFSKLGLQKSVVFICVDDRNIRLPRFITVVPTLYLNKQKKILTDEEITNWMNEQTKKEGEEDLMAYHGNNGGYSSSFSFLDDGGEGGFVSKYSFLESSETSIETPKEFSGSNSSGRGSKGGMDSALEQLQQSRNSEPFSQGISRI